MQVDEDDIECVHHRRRRLSHLAIQAEDRDAMHRVGEVGSLDHVVLLVAAQTMLRTERSGQIYVGARGKRIKRMPQILGDRSGMREQHYAPALQRGAQPRLGEKPVDAEFHGRTTAGSSSAKQSE